MTPKFHHVCLAGVLLLMGCDQGPAVTVHYAEPVGIESRLTYATTDGPILAEVHHAPFSADQVRARMGEAIGGREVRFTGDRESAARPEYRVVVAFDASPGAGGKALCRGEVPPPVSAGKRLTVLGVFCEGEARLSEASGWLEDVIGPDDPRLAMLIGTLTRALFPADEI